MKVRKLKIEDTQKCEDYLSLHKSECMFMCSNLKIAGIEYKGMDYEGEYFGCFDSCLEQLNGVIVHYWNGNIMMYASNHIILDHLVLHLKRKIKRSIAGVIGPNAQVEHVIKNLEISNASFSINRYEGLYEMNLSTLNTVSMPDHFDVVSAKEVSKPLLIAWRRAYRIEALGAAEGRVLEKQVSEDVDQWLYKNDCWILLSNGTPVSLSAFNARLEDRVSVGPVWTPPEHRNQGFARVLLAYTLDLEKRKGTQKAVLFTHNPAAIKAYLFLGFKQIGDYRLALLNKPMNLQNLIEFTACPVTSDIDFLTQKINEETPDFGAATSFAFFLRDEAGNMIAGCNGSVIFGCIYTDQLWVHPAYRKNGLGHQLMDEVHEYGKKMGCSMATVNTMSFQYAQSFYEKLGYVVDFQRWGYHQDSVCLFMRKAL